MRMTKSQLFGRPKGKKIQVEKQFMRAPQVSMSVACSRRKLTQSNDTGWYETPPSGAQKSHATALLKHGGKFGSSSEHSA